MTTFREKEELLKIYQMSGNNVNQIGY